MPAATRDSLLDDFRRIRTFKRGGKRAPHKPLLLLIALARLQRGEPRWVAYTEIEPLLAELLRRYSPFGNPTPWNPFWRLRNDAWQAQGGKRALWELRGSEVLMKAARKSGTGPQNKFLTANGAEASFDDELHTFLAAHPSVVNDLAEDILERNFPPTYHEELLDEIGMPWVVEWDRSRKKRKHAKRFRKDVLAAYNYACAFCGYDGRIGELSLGLEAAHIKWHAMGGPDKVTNGLCLCTFHHKVFDYGAIALSDDLKILVKSEVNWRASSGDPLLGLRGHKLRKPATGDSPAKVHLRWHRREVFGQDP